MADDNKELGKALLDSAITQARETGANIVLVGARLDVNATATTTMRTDMTPEAARAAIEIARLTHAVPAQEQTNQARQPTWRVAICVSALVVGIVAMAIRPEVAWQIASAVGVLEFAFGGAEVVARWKGKDPPPGLPPKNGGAA